MFLKLYFLLSILIILFGLIHISFAFCFDVIDTYTVWFVGSGVAIILAGAINLVQAIATLKILSYLNIFSNTIMFLLSCLSIFAMKDIQVYVGMVLFGLTLICSIKNFCSIYNSSGPKLQKDIQ